MNKKVSEEGMMNSGFIGATIFLSVVVISIIFAGRSETGRTILWLLLTGGAGG